MEAAVAPSAMKWVVVLVMEWELVDGMKHHFLKCVSECRLGLHLY